jgi:hypothetical protein
MHGRGLKPITAIGHPPTEDANWDGCCQGPPGWQAKIRDQPQYRKGDPEHLALHALILGAVFHLAYLGAIRLVAFANLFRQPGPSGRGPISDNDGGALPGFLCCVHRGVERNV